MDQDSKVALSAYYKQRLSLSNARIAELMHVDVSSISRYLKEAEDRNWLFTELRLQLPADVDQKLHQFIRNPGMEETLRDAFEERKGDFARSRKCIVATSVDTEMLGPLAADLLLGVLTGLARPRVLGVTWGRSTHATVSALLKHPPIEFSDLTVVPLQGGLGFSRPETERRECFADVLADDLAGFFRTRVTSPRLPFPAFIDGDTASRYGDQGLTAIASFVEADPSFRRIHDHYDNLDVAIVGVGALEPRGWAVSSGYLASRTTLRQLKNAGACGDIVCRFYRSQVEAPLEGSLHSLADSAASQDADSRIISEINCRAIGISLQQLRSRVQHGARVIAIAGGDNGIKAPALVSGILNGFITDIVTDSATAEGMLIQLRRRH